MSFTLYSKTGSDLTYSREAENFSRMMREGVYSGMQVYRGSSGFDISINAGYFSINGRLVREESVQANVLTIPTPVADEHNLVWIDFADPLAPTYGLKTGGTWNSPVELSPSESAYGLVLANVWVPSAATGISDCIIQNVDLEKIDDKPHNLVWNAQLFRITKGAGSYRSILTWNDLSIVGITPNDVSRKSIQTYVSEVASPLTTDEKIQRYAIVIARSRTGWNDLSEVISLEVVYSDDDPELGSGGLNEELVGNDDGGFVASSSKDSYPYRPNLDGAVIIAIHDRNADTVVYCGVGAAPGGFGLVNGQMENTIAEITSTVYGTSESGTSVDIDNLITNIAVIKTAGLDDAYDAMGDSVGGGRVVEVDRLPIELRHSQYDGSRAMYDRWSNALRVKLDSDEDGLVTRVPKAIDIYTKNDDKGERFFYSRRPATVSSLTCVSGNVTLTDGGTRVELATIGSITTTDVRNTYGSLGSVIFPERHVIEIAELLDGRASGDIFKIGVDFLNDVFFLIDEDTDADVLPVQLVSTSFPKVCTGTATLWEAHADMGFEQSKLKNLTVSGTATGPSSLPMRSIAIQSSEIDRKLSSDVMVHEDSAIMKSSLGLGRVTQIVSSATFGGYSGNRRMFTDGFLVLTTTFTSGAPIEVKVWDSAGNLIGTITTAANATSNDVGHSCCIRNVDTTYVAVPTGRMVEYFEVDSINSSITSLGSINYGDGATDEARVAIPITSDRFWIGGSHSTFTFNHNIELHSLGTGSVVQIYRIGKNALSTVYGGGLYSNGRILSALAIHGSTVDISTVECISLNRDGTITFGGSGSYESMGTTFFKNDWNNDLYNPLGVTLTESDLLVYGSNIGGDTIYVERHPIYTSITQIGTPPSSVDVVATKVLEVITTTGFTLNTRTFCGLDDGNLLMMGAEVAIAAGTPENSAAYIIDPKTMEIKWAGLFSQNLYQKLKVVAPGCCDGISAYFLDDPTSSGSASIKRIDLREGPCVGFIPSVNNTMKRSVVYGK